MEENKDFVMSKAAKSGVLPSDLNLKYFSGILGFFGEDLSDLGIELRSVDLWQNNMMDYVKHIPQ